MEGSPEGDKGLEAVQPTSPPWGMAAGRVEELVRGSEILALLRAAERTGFLRLLTRSVVSDDLAAALHLPVSRVDAALDVLAAHGIAEVRGDHWELAEGWSELVLGETPLPFAAYLGLGDVWTGQFETSLSSSRTYWQLDGASRLAVAKGISPEPSSSFTIAAARRDLQALPGVVPSLDAGGRVLELGCGVGSRLCATLLAFPSARAVGVELDASLVAFARSRAATLGLENRASFHAVDAMVFEPEGAFDLVTWSQFFFPEPTRSKTLATAYVALRPGGWITMPVIWDGRAPRPRSPEAEQLAEMRLMLDMWGVPMRTVSEVYAELEAAGFTELRADPGPGIPFVRGRRPY